MKTISGTEITAYGLCTKQHDYMYNEEIGPREYSDAIYRGIIGHKALAAYYQGIKDGLPVDEARQLAYQVIMDETTRLCVESPWEQDKLMLLPELKKLIETYFHYYAVETFEVLEVEQIFHAPIIAGELQYGMILDVLIRWTAGSNYGNIEVMDHKFVYNFKTANELNFDSQLAKYIAAVRANGYFVTGATFNQLRYRSIKNPSLDQIFRRTPLPANNFEVNDIWAEQKEIAVEIYENPRPVRRVLSPLVCKDCFYKTLCLGERQGIDTSKTRIIEFMPRERPLKDFVGDAA